MGITEGGRRDSPTVPLPVPAPVLSDGTGRKGVRAPRGLQVRMPRRGRTGSEVPDTVRGPTTALFGAPVARSPGSVTTQSPLATLRSQYIYRPGRAARSTDRRR